MNQLKPTLLAALLGSALLSGCQADSLEASAAISTQENSGLLTQVAETPPMGWNSFDAWDSRINEEDFRKTVDFMADNLLEHGWEYAVIDYIWWNPAPGAHNTPENYERRIGHPNIRLNEDGSMKYPEAVTLDEYGRLQPAPERFPSSADGKGFKPLADYVHSKGMKFGIHIMRGMHRQAWYLDTPILGTDKTARDIGKFNDHAGWLNNMFGIDYRLDGAQEFYNSLFQQYAEWGVDYIKADDMMGICGAPFHSYYGGEIEMMRKAIDNAGRPMVLSLSCGEAPIAQANHLEQNANMWRVSADFWDRWVDLRRSFQLMDKWSPFIGDHTWPDADMIPFGRLSLDDRPHGKERMSKFTLEEHYTLMTLFTIARSPLMIGAELNTTPMETIETFFKNDEVLYVNQHSRNNRQIIRVDEETDKSGNVNKYYAAWIAEDPSNGDYFIALFNLGDEEKAVGFEFNMEDMRGAYKVRDLWNKADIGTAEQRFSRVLPAHGAGLYRFSRIPGSSEAWVPPKGPVKHNNQ
ncbi:glycoside hydrolase family 27 protein [Alteromonas aestuariivivens]|uniref:Glycoside hydrolase family 27 protein n=1 Tax=Alteromonas aestuariivivens TaxID=1938339 RepID=A0A3D8MF41_9ALTE|nr:glycoside hydrolase family 27 protein [Alteromonas aestuariivivens]RDV29372.1 glycoside hydrolase family 27 protein [Alteromonas aestuariivivens]